MLATDPRDVLVLVIALFVQNDCAYDDADQIDLYKSGGESQPRIDVQSGTLATRVLSEVQPCRGGDGP